MPILFIALQCVQCSTMQVKQQKKSSNKWVCALCNQKQSILRIHARGHLARDIRNFVQQFNLSRMNRESCGRDSFTEKSDGDVVASVAVDYDRTAKRRADWSEYLDPDEDDICLEAGEDFEQGTLQVPDVTTELPTKEFNHLSKKRQTITEKKMPVKNFSRNYNVNYKDNLQKRKGSSSRWSEYLDKEEEHDISFEDSMDQPFFTDCSRVDEEVHPDFK